MGGWGYPFQCTHLCWVNFCITWVTIRKMLLLKFCKVLCLYFLMWFLKLHLHSDNTEVTVPFPPPITSCDSIKKKGGLLPFLLALQTQSPQNLKHQVPSCPFPPGELSYSQSPTQNMLGWEHSSQHKEPLSNWKNTQGKCTMKMPFLCLTCRKCKFSEASCISQVH